MYTGEAWDVLLCVLAEVQAPYLEEIVLQIDPEAFVIISATEHVQGGGSAILRCPVDRHAL
jgi:uncharacterized membrane-anchored protein YitT (DUF2179 family)